MPTNKLEVLRNYRDKIYVMTLICSKSASYYGGINNYITAFVILLSTTLSVLNGIMDYNTKELKYVNVVFNAVLAIFVGLNRAFRYGEKSSDFHKYCLNFTQLEHSIENEYNVKSGTISEEFLGNITTLYDTYLDGLSYSIPGNIIGKVKKEIGNEYDLPLSMGGKPCELKSIQQKIEKINNNPIIRKPIQFNPLLRGDIVYNT